MTLSVYISRNENTDEERGFEHPFERSAALQAAKLLWKNYATSKTHFALVANIETPPIDLVIVSSNGLGIIDLKDYSSPVGGKHDTPWHVLNESGVPTMQLKSGVHLNPFEQVKNYRRRVYGRLRGFVERNPRGVPAWIMRDRFYIQACVMFTAQKFDLRKIMIDPAVGRPWFNLKWLDEVSDWAYSLDFGRGHKLTETQIHTIATDFFGTQPWTEIEGHLDSSDPFGYLWIVSDGKELYPLTLDQDEMILGRSPTATLMLDSNTYPLVSRQHAIIRRRADKIYLSDLNSKHGTWVNGVRVDDTTGVSLKHGDQITLGKCSDDSEKIETGACRLIYKKISRRVDVTVSEVIS